MGFWSEGRLASTNHRFPNCDLVLQHIPHPLTKQTNKKKRIKHTWTRSGPPSSLDCPLRSDKKPGSGEEGKICCLEVSEKNNSGEPLKG